MPSAQMPGAASGAPRALSILRARRASGALLGLSRHRLRAHGSHELSQRAPSACSRPRKLTFVASMRRLCSQMSQSRSRVRGAAADDDSDSACSFDEFRDFCSPVPCDLGHTLRAQPRASVPLARTYEPRSAEGNRPGSYCEESPWADDEIKLSGQLAF